MPEIKIYTTQYCGFCLAALRLLDREGLEYEHIPVDRDPDTREWLVEATGQRTVPQIFWNGKSIGGYTELNANIKQLMAQE